MAVCERSGKRGLLMGCGIVACSLALLVCGVLGWLGWAGSPVDPLARTRQLPVYPGASSVLIAERPTSSGKVGVLTFDTTASIEDVWAFYTVELNNAGWHSVSGPSNGGSGGFTRKDGSFEGLEFTGMTGRKAGFPWFRIKRNMTPLWLQVDVTTGKGTATQEWSLELRQH